MINPPTHSLVCVFSHALRAARRLTLLAAAASVATAGAAVLQTSAGEACEGTIRCTTTSRVFVEVKDQYMEILKKEDLNAEGQHFVAGWEEANEDWARLPVKFDRVPDLQYRVQPDRSEIGEVSNQIVMIALLLNEDGSVQGAFVRDSTDGRLNRPTIEAVARWRFSPAEIGARPSRSIISIPVQF